MSLNKSVENQNNSNIFDSVLADIIKAQNDEKMDSLQDTVNDIYARIVEDHRKLTSSIMTIVKSCINTFSDTSKTLEKEDMDEKKDELIDKLDLILTYKHNTFCDVVHNTFKLHLLDPIKTMEEEDEEYDSEDEESEDGSEDEDYEESEGEEEDGEDCDESEDEYEYEEGDDNEGDDDGEDEEDRDESEYEYEDEYEAEDNDDGEEAEEDYEEDGDDGDDPKDKDYTDNEEEEDESEDEDEYEDESNITFSFDPANGASESPKDVNVIFSSDIPSRN
jgi:hypothetical protein